MQLLLETLMATAVSENVSKQATELSENFHFRGCEYHKRRAFIWTLSCEHSKHDPI